MLNLITRDYSSTILLIPCSVTSDLIKFVSYNTSLKLSQTFSFEGIYAILLHHSTTEIPRITMPTT